MKKYIHNIFVVLLLSLVACNGNLGDVDNGHESNNKVILSAKALGATTRATNGVIADTDIESTLAWIDVYILNENFNVWHSERIDKSSNPVVGGGEFVLSKNRDEFGEGEGYYVYMIANSTSALSDATTWDELKELTQKDEHLHLSGRQYVTTVTPPQYFLMDGFAYVPSSAGDKGPEAMKPIVVNSGSDEDIVLAGTLHRAAAKIMITITQGETVSFQQILEGSTPLYSYYQLPISTLVVTPDADVNYVSDKQTTNEWGIDNVNKTFMWTTGDDGKPVLTLVGYAYANDWSGKQATNETSLLLNIPMFWDKNGESNDGQEAASPVNWYKVPLSKNSKFERNTCYVINITINAIGAEDKNVPAELKDIEYVTLPWQDVEVNIGDNVARYLTLNTDLVKIYDSNFDLDQLTFTSSSPIKSIKLKDVFSHNARQTGAEAFKALEVIQEAEDATQEPVYEAGGDNLYAYYIDKFGQKIQLGTDPNFALKDVDHPDWTKQDILNLEANLIDAKQKTADGAFEVDADGKLISLTKPANEQYIRAVVPDDQKRALNGNIHIYSPINADSSNPDLDWNSHFNTVRYLEFEVMNEQGLTATFRVEQSPTVIIKNEEGYFSYRDDQKFSEDQEEASHFHNYMGWQSFHLTGLMWGYEWDWTNNPNPQDEDFYVGNTSRDYSFVINNPNNVVQNSLCEVIHYGNWGAPHTFIDSRPAPVTYRYGGIYRSTTHPTGSFFRHRYYQFPGGQSTGKYVKNGYSISSRLYDHPRGDVQGLAIGPYYERDGRTYRKQFVWNIQPIFYNLYVSKVFEEDDTASGKLRGQANICSMTSSVQVDPGVMDGEWITWGTQKFSNHRMYYVNTNNTHPEYTIGYPKMTDNEVPQNTKDNARLISPSLMVASQLGETFYQSIINTAASYNYKVPVVGKFYLMAEEHCREYVETTFIDKPGADGKLNGKWDEGEEVIHYKDWRLPTKAEIDRIIEFQESSRAMDKLLVGQYYFCITGNGEDADINNQENWVSNEVPNSTSTGYYIRCVRDAGRKTQSVKK